MFKTCNTIVSDGNYIERRFIYREMLRVNSSIEEILPGWKSPLKVLKGSVMLDGLFTWISDRSVVSSLLMDSATVLMVEQPRHPRYPQYIHFQVDCNHLTAAFHSPTTTMETLEVSSLVEEEVSSKINQNVPSFTKGQLLLMKSQIVCRMEQTSCWIYESDLCKIAILLVIVSFSCIVVMVAVMTSTSGRDTTDASTCKKEERVVKMTEAMYRLENDSLKHDDLPWPGLVYPESGHRRCEDGQVNLIVRDRWQTSFEEREAKMTKAICRLENDSLKHDDLPWPELVYQESGHCSYEDGQVNLTTPDRWQTFHESTKGTPDKNTSVLSTPLMPPNSVKSDIKDRSVKYQQFGVQISTFDVEYDENNDVLSMKGKKPLSKDLYSTICKFLTFIGREMGKYFYESIEEDIRLRDSDKSLMILTHMTDMISINRNRKELPRHSTTEQRTPYFARCGNQAIVGRSVELYNFPSFEISRSCKQQLSTKTMTIHGSKKLVIPSELPIFSSEGVKRALDFATRCTVDSTDLKVEPGRPWEKSLSSPENNCKSIMKDLADNLPNPSFDMSLVNLMVYYLPTVSVQTPPDFEPMMNIINKIAEGRPPPPHVSMRYELLRFCTLRSYPKEDKPFLIKFAEAGFYYASDGDGVVCYCCGIRRYNWTAADKPMDVHKRINQTCKFLVKNEENNVKNKFNGPFTESLMFIDSIPEPQDRQTQDEETTNNWGSERSRAPGIRPQSNQDASNQLGINTAIPKHTQYATKTSRVASYNGWLNSASHTPDELAEAGFFFAGFGDCVRCFYCGIGLRHWTREDNPWIEHARWSKTCVFVKQKKGDDFINLVQLAVEYSQSSETQGNSNSDRTQAQDLESLLLSDAAQSVLEMGYQPRIIKNAIEQIWRVNRQATITAEAIMETVLELEESEAPVRHTPSPRPGSTAASASAASYKEVPSDSEAKKITGLNRNDKEEKNISTSKQRNGSSGRETETAIRNVLDPRAIKAENEQLKEQTICKICLDQTVCIVFLPCGHLVACADCAPAMRKCPICRALVKGTVKTYMS